MHKTSSIPIMGLLALILMGCNGSSSTSRIISNQSSRNIKIVLYGAGGRLSDTLLFVPGQSIAISQKNESSAQEEENDCSEPYDSMFAMASDTLMVTKLIQNDGNWEVVTDQTKQVPREFEHTCKFIVRDSDITF